MNFYVSFQKEMTLIVAEKCGFIVSNIGRRHPQLCVLASAVPLLVHLSVSQPENCNKSTQEPSVGACRPLVVSF